MRLPGQPSKAPIPEGRLACAVLGRVLLVDVGGIRLEWKRQESPEMCWYDRGDALVIVDKLGQYADFRGHMQLYTDWHEREPEQAASVRYAPAKWQKVGPVTRVDYWSDKKGERAEYTHEVGPGTYLYESSSGLIVIKGKMRAEAHGLIG